MSHPAVTIGGMPPRSTLRPGQRSLDDLGTTAHRGDVLRLDLETTGGRPQRRCDHRDRRRQGVRRRMPRHVPDAGQPGAGNPTRRSRVLTGITDSMVVPAPRIDGGAADAARVPRRCRDRRAQRRGSTSASSTPPWSAAGDHGSRRRAVDTAALARRLVRDEVPNCRLGTLASRLRLDHRPCHRALDDALATADLLHLLLERAAGLGVTGLDDLRPSPSSPATRKRPSCALTDRLPRGPGVYMFRGSGDEVLYVGKATNLRQRVRSYFGRDDRRKIGATAARDARRASHRSPRRAVGRGHRSRIIAPAASPLQPTRHECGPVLLHPPRCRRSVAAAVDRPRSRRPRCAPRPAPVARRSPRWPSRPCRARSASAAARDAWAAATSPPRMLPCARAAQLGQVTLPVCRGRRPRRVPPIGPSISRRAHSPATPTASSNNSASGCSSSPAGSASRRRPPYRDRARALTAALRRQLLYERESSPSAAASGAMGRSPG